MKSQNETSGNLWTYSTAALRTEAKVNDYTQAPICKTVSHDYTSKTCLCHFKEDAENESIPSHDEPLRPFPRPQSTSPNKGITYAGAHFYHKRR
ncbi:hypothetical protein CDAR_101811 [Caerostris darwini]|uniref:Uncharacterized protein n=1 Tax=Caerostris darwini TaxID=1538125 RepID=A0AAV4SC33_9ARAC|nr:hypothetical protein CDAR_101811 [Caerostris darwini]